VLTAELHAGHLTVSQMMPETSLRVGCCFPQVASTAGKRRPTPLLARWRGHLCTVTHTLTPALSHGERGSAITPREVVPRGGLFPLSRPWESRGPACGCGGEGGRGLSPCRRLCLAAWRRR
jgi:hypothetical protein